MLYLANIHIVYIHVIIFSEYTKLYKNSKIKLNAMCAMQYIFYKHIHTTYAEIPWFKEKWKCS